MGMRKINWQCEIIQQVHVNYFQLVNIREYEAKKQKGLLKSTTFGSITSYGIVIIRNSHHDFEPLLSKFNTFIYYLINHN